ncbi:MAG: hypothetical protein ACXV3F_00365 [Frankiaceae bacterium]
MATDPWTGARYPVTGDAPNGPAQIQNAVTDLSDSTCPSFATPAARDTAFSNWQTAGNTAVSGMLCFTRSDGRYWRYDTGSSAWLYAGGNPPPIVACTAGSGWSIDAARPAGVYRDASGLLHLVGNVSPNTSYAPGDGGTHTMLVLPTGYRPANLGAFTATVGSPVNVVVTCAVDATGSVTVVGCSNASTTSTIPSGAKHSLDPAVLHPTYNNAVPLP